MKPERPRGRWTRREFLVAGTGVALGTAGAVLLRRRPYRAGDFARPARSPVMLMPASGYDADLASLVGESLGALDVDVRGKSVLLKPNMVEYDRGTVINTDPAVVAGAAEAMLRAGAAEVVVAEGPGHRRDTEYLVTATGLGDVLRDLRLRFVDLNTDDVRMVPLKTSFMELPELALPVSLLRADLVVSMPKVKTHHWAGMTCSMKNLFGVVPSGVYGWPKNLLHLRGIANSIVDLAATVRPGLAIADGIVGMEGDGPIRGRPRPLGMLAVSRDPVALDATCARAIGLEPASLTYLEYAGQFLGNVETARIEQRGEPVERFATRFEVVEDMAGHLAGE